MTTYPSCSLSPAPALTDEGTLEATLECLLEHVTLEVEGSSSSAENLFEILLQAASRHDRRVVYRELFSLKTMLEFLSQAVERHFPPITAVYLPVPNCTFDNGGSTVPGLHQRKIQPRYPGPSQYLPLECLYGVGWYQEPPVPDRTGRQTAVRPP